MDIIPANGGKGVAVEKVLEFYGIDKADSIAFGDGNNDIEMFGPSAPALPWPMPLTG